MREREAAGVRARLLAEEGTPAWRDRSRPRARDLIVVATQTLEVGADLDFDVLVTETCGTRALIQRLGRLNRLGETHDAAGAIVHAADRKEWPVYGEEPLQVWQRLNAAQLNDTIDLAPAQAAAILGPPNDEPARVGELLQAHLWEWAKTSFPPADEAPVDLFFSGFDEQMGRVSVCWRAHLPKDEVRLFPGVTESEVIEVPLTELRDALQAQHIDSVRRLADDRISLETVARTAVRPGDGIVLPTTVNLYDRDGWNPNPAPGSDDVLDVSLLRAGVLPLSRSVLANLALGAGIPKSLSVLIDPDEDGLAPEEERDLVEELLAALRAGPHHPWLGDEEWQQFLADMGTEVLRPVDDAPFLQRPARDRLHVEVRADAFDEMSFDVASSLLADHQGAVADVAEKIAGALGIDPMLRQAVKEAARLHDVGKADPRFQRWLDPRLTSLKAKSQTPRFLIERERRAAGWPKGGRHELVSLHILTQYVASLDDQPTWDPELLLHLVAAHHGQGRPLVPVADDPTPPRFTFDLNGRHVAVRDGLHWVDWSQPSRFRSLCERYGYWGLALMEAIVRQADQVVSSAGGVV
jgi:CRISPR-associated endonuclease/helicase Cas3